MGLTKHQQEVQDEAVSILDTSNVLLLEGSAGVGKTYLANTLIQQVAGKMNNGKTIYCSAPTNKAVAVLQGKVDDLPNMTFITTHSALKLKRNIDFKTGEITFKPNIDPKYPPLKGVGLFVIDEASMLSSELLGYVEEYAGLNNTKIIFIGDEKQLNPVGEDNSPVFHRGYPKVQLTEIVRQGSGNPIISLSRNLSGISAGVDNRKDIGGYIYSNDKDRVIQTLAAVNGTDELKYLAWTNKEVDMMNFLVRRAIYGTPKKIEVGETLVFNAPYKEKYFTNEEVRVTGAEIKEKDFLFVSDKSGDVNPDIGGTAYHGKVKLKYYSITCKRADYLEKKDKEKATKEIIVIHEDSEKKYKDTLKLIKNKAKFATIDWKDFYSFTEQFADLKYNHAITVHKSQGSTYKKTILNVSNISRNPNPIEKQRLTYTAVTRASELLILYNY